MNSTKSLPEFATERQISLAEKVGLEIDVSTPYQVAYEMIGDYIAANPLSEEEREARRLARRERLAALPANEKQIALISKITRGKFVPTNQPQVQGFFAGRRNRQTAPAAAE